MVVSFYPQGGAANNGFNSWQQMGNWYLKLTTGKRDASPEITQQVASLTASASTQLEKMKALAKFVQHDIRYVGIELGIGGFQPHAASEVFAHHYGDCKDKATLMSSMLSRIGDRIFLRGDQLGTRLRERRLLPPILGVSTTWCLPSNCPLTSLIRLWSPPFNIPGSVAFSISTQPMR